MAVLFAGALSAYGQGVKFGVKGGIDLAQFNLKNASEILRTNNNTGWFIGPTVKLSLPAGIGFDLAALFNHRRTDVDIYYMDDKTTDTRKLEKLKTNQIIVPLNVRYDIGLSDALSIFGFAGPQVAFRIGDEVQSLADLKNDAMDWRLKSSNFSVNAGLGIVVSNLQLSANYNVGIGKTGDVTWKDAVGGVVDGYRGKYNSWQIALAYYF